MDSESFEAYIGDVMSYVKEWLGAMVAGKIIEVDSDSKLYFLPLAHRPGLKKGDMVWFRIKMVHAGRWNHLRDCFKKDGPSGYVYPDYSEIYSYMDTWREMEADVVLDDGIIPILQAATSKLGAGGMFIDVGCGSGNFVTRLARRFPECRFMGLDFGEDAIKEARRKADDSNLTNVTFDCADATNLPESWTEKFDIVLMIDVLHDTSDPLKILSEIARILKKDGIFNLVEINSSSSHFENRNNPVNAMHYSISLYSCLPSSLSSPPHAGLGACWGVSEIRKTVTSSGFNIESETVINKHDINISFICRKSK